MKPELADSQERSKKKTQNARSSGRKARIRSREAVDGQDINRKIREKEKKNSKKPLARILDLTSSCDWSTPSYARAKLRQVMVRCQFVVVTVARSERAAWHEQCSEYGRCLLGTNSARRRLLHPAHSLPHRPRQRPYPFLAPCAPLLFVVNSSVALSRPKLLLPPSS